MRAMSAQKSRPSGIRRLPKANRFLRLSTNRREQRRAQSKRHMPSKHYVIKTNGGELGGTASGAARGTRTPDPVITNYGIAVFAAFHLFTSRYITD